MGISFSRCYLLISRLNPILMIEYAIHAEIEMTPVLRCLSMMIVYHNVKPRNPKIQSNNGGYTCKPIQATTMPNTAPATMSDR